MMQDSEAERLIHRYVDYMSGTSDDPTWLNLVRTGGLPDCAQGLVEVGG
jgi:hypothetical protein